MWSSFWKVQHVYEGFNIHVERKPILSYQGRKILNHMSTQIKVKDLIGNSKKFKDLIDKKQPSQEVD